MSEENLLRFLSYYTEVNVEWLIIGKGTMLKSPNSVDIVSEAQACYEKTESDIVKLLKEQLKERDKKADSLIEKIGRLNQTIEHLEAELKDKKNIGYTKLVSNATDNK